MESEGRRRGCKIRMANEGIRINFEIQNSKGNDFDRALCTVPLRYGVPASAGCAHFYFEAVGFLKRSGTFNTFTG
jgi:hypothetical protein